MDETDRKLLALLAEDASRTYAELGQLVHLTAPAVHERVKRLKRDGVIEGIVARVNAEAINCPLLAFVHVDTSVWGMQPEIERLQSQADVEEIHTVAGDTSLVLKVRMRDTKALEAFLAHLYTFEWVKATRSYVVLNSHLERGPRPQLGV